MSNPSTAVGVWVAELSQADRLGVRNLLLWVMKKSGRPGGKNQFSSSLVVLGSRITPCTCAPFCVQGLSHLSPRVSAYAFACVSHSARVPTCVRVSACTSLPLLLPLCFFSLSLSLFVFDSGLSVYDTPSQSLCVVPPHLRFCFSSVGFYLSTVVSLSFFHCLSCCAATFAFLLASVPLCVFLSVLASMLRLSLHLCLQVSISTLLSLLFGPSSFLCDFSSVSMRPSFFLRFWDSVLTLASGFQRFYVLFILVFKSLPLRTFFCIFASITMYLFCGFSISTFASLFVRVCVSLLCVFA